MRAGRGRALKRDGGRRPVSQGDVQLWALLIGFLVFGTVVGALFVHRQLTGAATDRSTVDDLGRVVRSAPDTPGPVAGGVRADRRRPDTPPPLGSPGELASAIRSLTLRVVAERAPAGWSALVLCPPPHPEQMTWHVHLAPAVALDLRDGRSVPVAPPRASHEWRLAGRRTVGVGEGDPDPAPTDDTVSVRVTGPYLAIAINGATGEAPALSARVMLASGDELPQPRALATDMGAVGAALREAVEQAVGSRMLGSPPAVAYRGPSWAGHERVWLSISR